MGVCLEAKLAKDLAHLGVLVGDCGVEPLDIGVPCVDAEPFEEAKPDIVVARQVRRLRPRGAEVDHILLRATAAPKGLGDRADAAILRDQGGAIPPVALEHTMERTPSGPVGLREQSIGIEHHLITRLAP